MEIAKLYIDQVYVVQQSKKRIQLKRAKRCMEHHLKPINEEILLKSSTSFENQSSSYFRQYFAENLIRPNIMIPHWRHLRGFCQTRTREILRDESEEGLRMTRLSFAAAHLTYLIRNVRETYAQVKSMTPVKLTQALSDSILT